MQLRIRTETQTRVIETSNPQFVDYIANQITQGVIKTTPLKAKEPDVKIYQVLEDCAVAINKVGICLWKDFLIIFDPKEDSPF